MIDQTTLVAHVLIVPGFVFIPGSATFADRGTLNDIWHPDGHCDRSGTAASDLIHTAMAIVGLSAIIATSAVLFTIIKYLGAVCLICPGVTAIPRKTDPDIAHGALPITSGRPCSQNSSTRKQRCFPRRDPTVFKWRGKFVGSIYCAPGVRLAFQERQVEPSRP